MEPYSINLSHPNIRFATNADMEILQTMWNNIFGDNNDFIAIYFSGLIKPHQTLVWEENGEIASMLFMWDYQFNFHDIIVPCYYLAGLGTLPKYRKRGIMGQLLKASNNILEMSNVPISIIVPANEKLFDYYSLFGYVKVFEKDTSVYNIYDDFKHLTTMEERFEKFNNHFNSQKFIIRKTFDDFKRIWRDLELSANKTRNNLRGMLRVNNFEKVLWLFAKVNPEISANIGLYNKHSKSENFFKIDNGKVELYYYTHRNDNNIDDSVFMVSDEELTKLIFEGGEIENALSEKLIFPKVQCILNFMLE